MLVSSNQSQKAASKNDMSPETEDKKRKEKARVRSIASISETSGASQCEDYFNRLLLVY